MIHFYDSNLILTNRKYSFKNTISLETGLSDHHMICIMLKSSVINEEEPKFLNYKDYKTFSFENFKGDFSNAL